jgi:anti-anti-sigma regulatory factor
VEQVLRNDAVKGSTTAGELVLDFSSVLRIDVSAVRAMEDLARLAAGRSARIVLRAVNLDIYKVLKLAKLTDQFSFLP